MYKIKADLKASENTWGLRAVLKLPSEGANLIVTGNLFESLGAAADQP